MDVPTITEDNVRRSTHCCGCGGEKQHGCVICWGCFKSGVDGYGRHAGVDKPYKYFRALETSPGQWEDEVNCLNRWLAKIGRPPVEDQLGFPRAASEAVDFARTSTRAQETFGEGVFDE